MNMQKKKSLVTRGFALLLALVFCLGLTPLAAVTAYAEEPSPAAEPGESPALPEPPVPEDTAAPDEPENPETPEAPEMPDEPEKPAEESKAPEIVTPEGWVRIDPARLLAVLDESRELGIEELFDLAAFAYNGQIQTNALRFIGEGLDETVYYTAEAVEMFTQPILLNADGLYCGGIAVALFCPALGEDEDPVLRTDGGGANVMPLDLGDRVQGTTSGGGVYFDVGFGDGSWINLQMTNHSIIADGQEYVAYCVKTYYPGPNEGMTEAEVDFSSYVKTGLQAILDNGYPYGETSLDAAKARYCTAFAVAKWLAINGVSGCDPVYAGWNNFKVYDSTMKDYVDSLISKAQNGAVVSNGYEVKYYAPDTWNRQTLVANREAGASVSISKSSAVPAMTAGNSCYSLEGAVYGIYSDAACTNLLEPLTTDANGQATSGQLERGVYYVKEISASKGYLLDSTVYTADAGSGDVTVSVKETPGNDPVGITITKITSDPATTLPSLEGTQFTIKFYGGQYGSVEELPSTPLRTWVIETKSRTVNNQIKYEAFLRTEYKVSGDDFYSVDTSGNAVLPLGTITIQETAPAEGYTTIGGYVTQAGQTLSDADGIILLNITEDAASTSGGALKYGNEYTKEDKPIYGGVSVQKRDAETGEAVPQGGASLAGAELKIISLNETDVTVNGQVYTKGQAVCTGTTDENGQFRTAADLLPMGRYKLVETAAPEGYQLAGTLEQEFEISVDGLIVDLTGADSSISDRPIRADFSLEKQDGDSKKPMANVLFEITSTTTGDSHTFTTDENGFFSSAGSELRFGEDGEGGALLYDTYIIRELECEANQGYTLAEPITLIVTGENTLIQVVGVYNYQMRMSTLAEFRPSGSQWSLAFGTVTARDTISYENLLANTQYTLVGKLWNKTAGAFLADTDGNEITAEKTFVTTARAGVQTMEFRFEADTLAGTDIVVFEYLYVEGKDEPVLTHTDPEDESQTLHFPAIGTNAADAENGSSVSLMADEITIADTVTYVNLIPGEEYTVKGMLMDTATGTAALDAEGNEILAESTFIAELKDGSVVVSFTFKGNFETAKKFVAFEELYYEGNLFAVHTDIEDEGQTIYIPKIQTIAKDAENGKQIIMAEENVSILDTVRYEGLKPGLEYSVAGKIVLQSAPETVLAEAELTFTPDSENGEIEMGFTLDATELAGKAVVVFEAVYLDGALVAVHEDADDQGQTVYIPEIGTSAKDAENGSSLSLMAEEISIIDTVSYKGLKPGEEYTVKGVLMDKATGAVAMDADGNEITAETVFTPETQDGCAQVTFTFKGNFETAKKFVAFEEIWFKDVLVAVHADIEDEEQTVYIPKIRTSAISPITGEHLGAAGDMTVIDTVSYEGLKPGLEYVMYGLVVAADSPETILGGTMIIFTPETENGSAELELRVNAKDYAGKTVVVFESILLDGAVVAVHQDAEDLEQSVLIPSLRTQARDAELGGNTAIADEDVTIIDTVSYGNLIPGKEYTLSGELVLKSNPEIVLAEAELTFTPEAQSGEVELSFTFDGSKLAGEATVAFETLKYDGVMIAIHADIDDQEQTIIFPDIQTTATVEGIHKAQARDNITLRDAIAYTNLTAGENYTVCGVLMDKATGKPILDANGKEIRAESSFTAEADSGTVWLSFVFNGKNLEGKTLVAFDRLYLGTDTTAQPIAIHEDINSAEQSVEFATSIPKTGDESSLALWAALAALSLAAASTAIVLLRRKSARK